MKLNKVLGICVLVTGLIQGASNLVIIANEGYCMDKVHDYNGSIILLGSEAVSPDQCADTLNKLKLDPRMIELNKTPNVLMIATTYKNIDI